MIADLKANVNRIHNSRSPVRVDVAARQVKNWAMLFESTHLRITVEYGTATLWLGFPGPLANVLDLGRFRELDAALQRVAAARSLQILVVRSSDSSGFCAGIDPGVQAALTHPADRAAFAWYGQQVFNRLANLEAVTLAQIEGPCLGAGLELALACDYRLCVARPGTLLGFPDGITCFGGSPRLKRLIGRRANQLLSSGRLISGREAQSLKLVDRTCCDRRARIELRSILDRLELKPFKPRAPFDPIGLAAERRNFAAIAPPPVPKVSPTVTHNPVPGTPDTIGLLGEDEDAARLAGEAAIRGVTVVVSGNRAPIYASIDAVRRSGFITPLEAEQARVRVRSSDTLTEFRRAGLVFVASGHNPFRLAATVLPRVVVCVIRPQNGENAGMATQKDAGDWPRGGLDVFPYPRRVVQLRFLPGNRLELFPTLGLDSDATVTLATWLKPFVRETIVHTAEATEAQHESDGTQLLPNGNLHDSRLELVSHSV